MTTTQEFLLWSNCTNKCDFCWQYKKNDIATILNEQEMIECIQLVCERLDHINIGDDVLLVGGEILSPYHRSVDNEIRKLIDKCRDMLNANKIRYLYINTNLIYKDKSNLIYLLDKMQGVEDKLKFTSSYDIYGRFHNKSLEELFLDNLRFVSENYPKVNIVVNTIITKQMVNSGFDFDGFQKEYNLKYINFIPYVPVEDDRSMDVTFKDIVKVLAQNEKKHQGFIDFYINDFDLNQDKRLYEYRKGEGFVECTSKYLECHHNENFKKVLNGECYICKLKEVFR